MGVSSSAQIAWQYANMFSLGVMLGVYTAGISGAHLNPAGKSLSQLQYSETY